MKPKVIILVGPPMSGKDTYLQNNDFKDYTIISRDDLLLSMHHNNDYAEAFAEVDQREVDKELIIKIKQSVDNSENVIINMTNLTKKTRKRHLSKFPKDTYERLAIVFPRLDMPTYIFRNLSRKKVDNKFIPLNVLETMLNSWEDTTAEEGFDTIIKL